MAITEYQEMRRAIFDRLYIMGLKRTLSRRRKKNGHFVYKKQLERIDGYAKTLFAKDINKK
jgi:hypothetical protein